MSAFLEEYGKVIVVIVVIGALIALAFVFNKMGKESGEQSFARFINLGNQSITNAELEAGVHH